MLSIAIEVGLEGGAEELVVVADAIEFISIEMLEETDGDSRELNCNV